MSTEIQRLNKGKTLNIKTDVDCFVMVLPINKAMPLSKSSAKTRIACHVGGTLPEAIENPHSKSDVMAKFNGNVYVSATDDEAITARGKIALAKEALR